RAKNIILLSR
nr:Chain B, Alkaline phosphatase [Escherichia coli K-12]